MERKTARNQPDAGVTPAPRKRFRVEKLEERVMPAARYNPQSKLVGEVKDGGASGGSTSSGLSGSVSIF